MKLISSCLAVKYREHAVKTIARQRWYTYRRKMARTSAEKWHFRLQYSTILARYHRSTRRLYYATHTCIEHTWNHAEPRRTTQKVSGQSLRLMNILTLNRYRQRDFVDNRMLWRIQLLLINPACHLLDTNLLAERILLQDR